MKALAVSSVGSVAGEPVVLRGARRIRAVLFDVDGTLYHQRRLRALMMAEIAAAPILLRSAARAAAVVRVLRAYRTVHEEMRGRSTVAGRLADFQVRQAAARTGASEEQVRQIVEDWMFRRPLKYLAWCRRSGLRALLLELQGRGLRLGVLSDYPAQSKLDALGVASFFSPVLCTTDADVNALKPHPRGFWRACELWNLPPEEVLYVGDRPDV